MSYHRPGAVRQSDRSAPALGGKTMRFIAVLVGLGVFGITSAWSNSVRGTEPYVKEDLRAKSHSGTPLTTDREGAAVGCGPECDFCWLGTTYENNCPLEWEGDGECDCGCQFSDTGDCPPEPTGACCSPFIPSGDCFSDMLSSDCFGAGGAYMGDSSTCASVDCAARCDQVALPCEYCWLDTMFYLACPAEWYGDGTCDCGCQFDDPADCGGGGDLPDLIIQASSRSPAAGVVPGGMITLSDTVENQGVGAAPSSFWATWFISEDITVTAADYMWAFHEVPAGLQPGQTAGGYGDVSWPDAAPYNTPGQIYYIAVMADDLNDVDESNETNNWGEAWPVVLAGGGAVCPGEGDCCQANGTPGCSEQACCELV